MIKNSGLGQLAEAAAGEEFYPVRRRGEKRRLNPNRAAIEWLESDAKRMMHAVTVYMMDDTGARYSLEEATVLRRDMLKVTKTSGSMKGSHHSRPIFECLSVDKIKRTTCSSSSCGNCDNFAYSWTGCPDHDDSPAGECDSASGLNRAANVMVEYQAADTTHRITWGVDYS